MQVLESYDSLEKMFGNVVRGYRFFNIFHGYEITVSHYEGVSGNGAGNKEMCKENSKGSELKDEKGTEVQGNTEQETEMNFAKLLGLEKQDEGDDSELEIQLRKLNNQTNNKGFI